MDPTILQNHAAISGMSLKFLDYAVTQGQYLAALSELDDEMHPMFRDYPYALHAWPWFLGPAMRARLAECVASIPKLMCRAILAEFEEMPEEFAAYFNVPLPLAHLFLDAGSDVEFLLQRTDAVLTATGMKIVELNIGSSIGGWQIHWMNGHYRKQPGLDRFMLEHDCRLKNIPQEFMEFLIRSVRKKGLDSRILFIVDEAFVARQGPQALSEIFHTALAHLGETGEIHFRTNWESTESRGDGIYLEGKRLGAILNANPKDNMVSRAALANQVLSPDNPIDAVMGDKRALSILYQHKDSGLFDDAERAIIEEFIPWGAALQGGTVTFRGEQYELETLLLTQRAQFVVKVATGQQGDDVFIGKYMDDAAWAAVVARGLGESGWLVQEFCASLPFYGQHGEHGHAVFDVIWGIFGFGTHYGGCWLRLMNKDSGDGVINSAKGAREAIVYEVDQ